MKQNYFRLASVIAGLSLALLPIQTKAANALEVIPNDSLFYGANLTATLEDGSTLGFYLNYDRWTECEYGYYDSLGYYKEYGYNDSLGYYHDSVVYVTKIYVYNSEVYFCDAISGNSSLIIPDTIRFNDTDYPVVYYGHYWDGNLFEQAQSVTSLTLPKTIIEFRSRIPQEIKDLHLASENPPSSITDYIYADYTTIWVPQIAYQTYQNKVINGEYGWSNFDIHYEGWEPIKATVNVEIPGNLSNALLEAISQWNEVNELTVTGSLNDDDMKLFKRLSQLRKLDLSQTDITTISGCSGLTKLTTVLLPVSVKEIGEKAFEGCRKLDNIYTPNVVSIGSYAFYGCTFLTSIDLPNAIEIGDHAFYNSGLKSISLPQVYYIGENAFQDCYYLSSVNIPEATTIGNYAFYETNIQEISLPKATFIGEQCFCNCDSLKKVTLAEGLERISYYCFAYCYNLSSVNFPSTLKEIDDDAFRGTAITTAILPEGLEKIDSYAFYYCQQLTTISIPSTIQYITNGAFLSCPNVTDVYCYSIVPPATTAFNGYSYATLHVPSFSSKSYMLDDNWYHFNQIVAIDGKISQLTINQYFSINSYDGLDEKVDMEIVQNGHLTVSAGSAFNLGYFGQEQSTFDDGYYYDDNGNRIQMGFSSLIAENEMSADSIVVALRVRTDRWNFISLPFDVNVSEIEYPEGTLWVIRKYSGADRASLTGNTWQNMTDGMTLKAGEGYILHCSHENANVIGFLFHAVNNSSKNKLFAHQDVVKELNRYDSEFAHNSSWNLVGNPYPAFYDTRAIEHNGTITVYNGDYYYGGYTAYSLVDDDYVLRPNEAFFVQCPDDTTSMTFKAEGRLHTYDIDYNNGKKRASTRTQSNRSVYNFILEGADLSDRARLVINPQAKMDYEISCDASKFMSDNADASQLYIIDGGVRYAIDERPIGEGKFQIGAKFGKAGTYTILLSAKNDMGADIILTDNETGQQVNLKDGAYSFSAKAGIADNRFIVTLSGGTTGIKKVAESVNENPVYNTFGRQIPAAQKGINIMDLDGRYQKVLK